MIPRHLVVVSYFHPPFPTSGGNRWVAMAHYLRAAGHRVTFVASDAFGSLPDDEVSSVIRVRDLKSVALLRRALRRGPLPESGRSRRRTAAVVVAHEGRRSRHTPSQLVAYGHSYRSSARRAWGCRLCRDDRTAGLGAPRGSRARSSPARLAGRLP